MYGLIFSTHPHVHPKLKHFCLLSPRGIWRTSAPPPNPKSDKNQQKQAGRPEPDCAGNGVGDGWGIS